MCENAPMPEATRMPMMPTTTSISISVNPFFICNCPPRQCVIWMMSSQIQRLMHWFALLESPLREIHGGNVRPFSPPLQSV